jgi:hypothetical protein
MRQTLCNTEEATPYVFRDAWYLRASLFGFFNRVDIINYVLRELTVVNVMNSFSFGGL